MGAFIEEGVKSGVFLSGEGLQPSSKGVRVRYAGSKRTVTDGPFAETKELIAGYAMLQFTSKEEAIEWTKRFVQVDAPGRLGAESECEIRQVFEAEDFGKSLRPSSDSKKSACVLRWLRGSNRREANHGYRP